MKPLEDFIKQNKNCCKERIIGSSELDREITALFLKKGRGLRKKALLISYLHGNEPETLQANLSTLENALRQSLLNRWEIVSIPVANPDGKEMNTRENARMIDLNRDSILKQAKETRAIIRLYENINPSVVLDYHSNLSNKFSCVIVPRSTDIGLCRNVILSYHELRKETSLHGSWQVTDTRYNTIARFFTKGLYILEGSKGLVIEHAAQKSRVAAAIEDYGIELSVEFSTEILKRYER
ncbi:hypothetical protein FJZ53_00270 [Candidatus Woesearchaeota archaeon]|nr:hypothetical protein [Candidatus Woesearchaeota archaeon]